MTTQKSPMTSDTSSGKCFVIEHVANLAVDRDLIDEIVLASPAYSLTPCCLKYARKNAARRLAAVARC